MKTYEVTRTGSGQIGVLVKDDGREALLLKHCVVHSPTGFETGYAGSAPADLALSILADHLDVIPERIGKIWNGGAWSWNESSDPLAAKALRLHQEFKAHFIAPRRLERGHSYEIQAAHIAAWVGNREGM
jgi:hypothetical protein